MSFIQVLAVIIFSAWYYGKIYLLVSIDKINFSQAVTRTLFIILMSYLMFSNTLLCCAIITSKFCYDTIIFIFDSMSGSPSFFNANSKYKNNLHDTLIGMICCFVYIVAG
jgi:hypothetical protein